MSTPEKYCKKHLEKEVDDIEKSDRNIELSELSIYEKTIIYKYSLDGYREVNERLRKSKGKKMTEFGKLLSNALDKLPDHEALVYRSADLTKSELKRYQDALKSKAPLLEYAFISTTKFRLIAMNFNGNTLFRIYSRTAKDIEKIAKFGTHGNPNEKEVLFNANKKFNVLAISQETTYTLITMEEI